MKTASGTSHKDLSGGLLLDTNVIQYAKGNEAELGQKTKELLESILRHYEGTFFATSAITLFEAQRNASVEKRAKIKHFLNEFSVYELDDQILEESASLASLYDAEPNVNSNSISVADLFIGATSIITGWPILTADCNDFPRPFFDEIHKEIIQYKKGTREKLVVLYFLYPDYKIFSEKSKNLR